MVTHIAELSGMVTHITQIAVIKLAVIVLNIPSEILEFLCVLHGIVGGWSAVGSAIYLRPRP